MKRLRKLICMTLVLVLCLGLLPVNGAAMRIQHNITSLNAHRNLTNNNGLTTKNLEKLSSGYRINRAGDNAAGLAISEQMRSQIRGLEMAQRNAEDGISLVQTAEGALQEVHSMLARMQELASQAASGAYDDAPGRAALQAEFASLTAETRRIGNASNFNGMQLLTGYEGRRFSAELQGAAQIITDSTNAARSDLGIIGGAIHGNPFDLTRIGSLEDQLKNTIGKLEAAAENLPASGSQIRDVDMAKEMEAYTKNNILLQAAQSMLAQANATPQHLLSLMDGSGNDTGNDSGNEGKETSVDGPRTLSKEDKGQWEVIVTKDLLEKTIRETHGGTQTGDQPMSIYFQAAAVDGKNPRVVITPDALEALFSYNATLGINTEFGSVSFSYEVLQALKEAGAAAMTVELIPNADGSVTFSILAADQDGKPIEGQIPATVTLPTGSIQVATYVAGADGKAQPSSITSPNAGGMAALLWLDVDGTAQTFTVTTDESTQDSESWEENLFNRSSLLGLLPTGAEGVEYLNETISKDDLVTLLYLVHCNGQGAESAADWFQGIGVTLPQGELTLEALLEFYKALGFGESTIESVREFLAEHFTTDGALTWGEALSCILNMAEMGCDPASGTLQLAPYTARLAGAPKPEPAPEPGEPTGNPGPSNNDSEQEEEEILPEDEIIDTDQEEDIPVA